MGSVSKPSFNLLQTLTQIADRLRVTRRMVDDTVRVHRIKPDLKAGIVRLYGNEAFERIAKIVKDRQARRKGVEVAK